MKDLLTRFAPIEFFAYLCPGTLVLVSLILWVQPADLGKAIGSLQILAAFFCLVLAYGMGMLALHLSGVIYHLNKRFDLPPHKKQLILFVFGTIFDDLPKPSGGRDTGIRKITGKVQEMIGPKCNISNIALWDLFALYRSLKSDELDGGETSVLGEAELYHHRFMFCLGMAVALFLFSLNSILRILCCFFALVLELSQPLLRNLYDVMVPIMEADNPLKISMNKAMDNLVAWHGGLADPGLFWLFVFALAGWGAAKVMLASALSFWRMERALTLSLLSKENSESDEKDVALYLTLPGGFEERRVNSPGDD